MTPGAGGTSGCTTAGSNPAASSGSVGATSNGVNVEAASFGPSTPSSVLGEQVSLETPAAAASGRPAQVLGEQFTRAAAVGPLAFTGGASLLGLSVLAAALLAIGSSILWLRRRSDGSQVVSVGDRIAAF